MVVGHFVEVCRKRGLKGGANKEKSDGVRLVGGLGCEIHVDEAYLEQVSVLKYFRCVLDESGTDDVKCCRKLVSGNKVGSGIRSLVNARGVQGCYIRDCLCLFCYMAVR